MPLLRLNEIRERLGLIFPESAPDRASLTRELAAKTIATFLFIGAVGDPDREPMRHLRPSMVVWMDDDSISRVDDLDFVLGWHRAASRGHSALRAFLAESDVVADRWYAENSREPIRDEVIRPLAERYGAVLRRSGIAPSDASPALTLAEDFAALFDPAVRGPAVDARVSEWQAAHLGPAEQARLAARRRLQNEADNPVVDLPGRGRRRLPPGESSALTVAAITNFAPRLLAEPFVLAVCHSRDPLASEDERELRRVGLALEPEVVLPDVLLMDVADGMVWFVEVVATGGAIHERRRSELLQWAGGHEIPADRCRFVSVYRSRAAQVFRRTVGELAWDTLVWFADEPDRVFRLEELGPAPRPG
ncbi:MAG TPA: BsuBI/PstI family type II restriction endonuclease [Gaiellaceae bacterium]|nr:BsuBI/PstI family type II restriction endonuclease [Gaiellaceae bacterium]